MINIATIGLVGKSLKKDEKRVPIHPDHICEIPAEVRSRMTFEIGYGEPFGVSDDTIAQLTSGKVYEKKKLLAESDCVIIPKPTAEALSMVKNGAVIWGWSHCVQQNAITQIAIDKKLTYISWEAMYGWDKNLEKLVHIFHKNNEIAGYAAVNHAIILVGLVGIYGRPLKVTVISFGAVSRGAVRALKGQGFSDITVLTERSTTEVGNQIPGIKYLQMVRTKDGHCFVKNAEGNLQPMVNELINTDIIVNGTAQNTLFPKLFISKAEASQLKKGALIIDVSCDENMGFWCARPTTFEKPIFEELGIYYYSVDHTPSLYWNSASWEISQAIMPFLECIAGGEEKWLQCNALYNAIEIKEGKIINEEIIKFQRRQSQYPYAQL